MRFDEFNEPVTQGDLMQAMEAICGMIEESAYVGGTLGMTGEAALEEMRTSPAIDDEPARTWGTLFERWINSDGNGQFYHKLAAAGQGVAARSEWHQVRVPEGWATRPDRAQDEAGRHGRC